MVRRTFKKIVDFVRLVRHLPPDPARGYSPDTTQIRDASRAAFGRGGGPMAGHGGAMTSSKQTDEMIGKAIADSHKEQRPS